MKALDDLDKKYKVVVIGKHTRVLRFDRKGRAHLMDFDFRKFAPSKRPMTGKRLGMLLQKHKCQRFRTGKRRGWGFPPLWEARNAWAKQMGSRLTWESDAKDLGRLTHR